MSKSSKTKTKQGTASSPSKQQEENNQLTSVIEALKNQITKLENKVCTLEGKVENLDSALTVAANTSSRLCIKVARLNEEIDRLYRYSRRNCLIVSGIPVRTNETTDDLRKEFEKKVIQDLDITSEEYYFE